MIKGIIFDFDNTLYDYDTLNKLALDYAFNNLSFNFDIDIAIIQNIYNKINREIKNDNNSGNKFNKSIYFKILFENLKIPIKYLNEYLSLYNSKFMEEFDIYPYVIELFIFLKSNDIKICILSNNIFFQQYTKLNESKLINYVDIILTSDECGSEKPSKNMFLLIQNKIKIQFDYLAYIGDSIEQDILPAIDHGMLTFWFNRNENFKLIDKTIYFGCFNKLLYFFKEYFKTTNDLIFISKYFGQSSLNTQGPGGNISIKLDNLLFIKSSGFILGNLSYDNGYCIVNNSKCNELRTNMINKLTDSKIFGYKVPSMETYFHSFMKKYTIHLHFTLSNIFFCSNDISISKFDDFKYNYKIIDYCVPGITLGNNIFTNYTDDCDIYILKNHGIIITANDINDILTYYEYIFNYFDKQNNYKDEYISFLINKIYKDHNINCVVKRVNISSESIKNIKYCFPDMVVFIKNIIDLNKLTDLMIHFIYYDIILYNNNVYCISENITTCYSLIEILESYNTLYLFSNQLNIINNLSEIREMPEEKYRNLLLK
jgi:putative hydrolase of the HAD superfamily